MEIWEPKPPGTLWATPGLLRDSFTFTIMFLRSWDVLAGYKIPLYVCPCIIYEIHERYPLDATIYLLL